MPDQFQSGPPAGSATPAELVIRPPTHAELPRALHLFRNLRLREGSRVFVAENTSPVSRFTAAAAWWVEAGIGRFQLACQPGFPQTDSLTRVAGAVASAAQQAGLPAIHYSDLLPDGHPWLELFQQLGFERIRSERCFETASRPTWTRIKRLYERHRTSIPSSWRTDPIRCHKPEIILELIAPHRLLPPDEVRHFWQTTNAAGFHSELSCILFDGDRPFGAFLARFPADILFVDVQVVVEPNPRLRSLGDLCLVYHVVRQVQPDGPIHWIRFRSGQAEHRQTANLALRMGGRELGRMHVLGKRLNP